MKLKPTHTAIVAGFVRKIIRPVLTAVFIGFVSPVILAQSSDVSVDEIQPPDKGSVITMEQAIRIALANNNDIKRALLSIKDADEQVTQAWGEYLPDISGDLSYTRNLQLPVIFFPDFQDPTGPLQAISVGEDNQWQGAINASQEIFSAETIIGINSADLFKTAQKENFRATSQQVVTETRKAYSNVLLARENLQLRKKSVERIKENLEDNRKRFEAGLIDEFQVLQLEVQLSNEQPQLTEARYQIEQAYRQLSIAMGIPVNWEYKVEGDLASYDVKTNQSQKAVNANLKEITHQTSIILSDEKTDLLVNRATDFRGDLRVLDFEEKLKNKEIMREKSLYLPSLSANYQMAWSAQEPGAPDFFGNEMQRARTQAFTVTLDVPIFQGLQRSTALTRRQIEKKDIQLQQEFAKKQAVNEIQTAQENINRIYEVAEARRAAIKQAKRNYEIALARFNRGVGSQLDVTNAELQLRQAETNYAQMVHEFLNAKADYDLAVGQIPFVDN